ncbi:MAG: YHS domain-containing (seleno)protein [Gammaproteobacteria bacterium]|nr:YHS domain-containing (seleno)protein [Gammaproteobacteria bacterium]
MLRQSRLLRAGIIVASATTLAGCGAMTAQNPDGGLSPINGIATERHDHLMLFGADVVAYFTEGRHVQGSPQYSSRHQGVDFHFATAEHKAVFDADPTAYLPQYGGYCTNGIAFGIPWGGNAEDFLVHDGKLYIFGGEVSKQAVMLDLERNLALADKYWAEEVAGNNSFWQRTKRLVIRVPHYQSGDEQAAAVEAARTRTGG